MKFNFNPSSSLSFSEGEEIHILGYKIVFKPKAQKESKTHFFLNIFQNIIWMTYRKNFPPLLPELFDSDYISDAGWGCMLRVAQMMFAEALKRHLFYDEITKKELVVPRNKLFSIIKAFLDNDYNSEDIAPYSIQKIMRVAYKELDMKPGSWFNPSNIFFVLEKLHLTNRLKGTEKMEFMIFNDGMVFLDKMVNKIGGQKCECDYKSLIEKSFTPSSQKESFFEFTDLKKSESEHDYSINSSSSSSCDSEIINDESENSCEYIRSSDFYDKLSLLSSLRPCPHSSNSSSLFLLILSQIGLDTPSPLYLPIVDELLKSPFSLGIAGGKPASALFLVGVQGERYFYLDPHFVQESVSTLDGRGGESYFCGNVRSINKRNISPSLCFGFYLRNLGEVRYFFYWLKNLSKIHGESFFLGLEENSEDFLGWEGGVGKSGELNESWEIVEKNGI